MKFYMLSAVIAMSFSLSAFANVHCEKIEKLIKKKKYKNQIEKFTTVGNGAFGMLLNERYKGYLAKIEKKDCSSEDSLRFEKLLVKYKAYDKIKAKCENKSADEIQKCEDEGYDKLDKKEINCSERVSEIKEKHPDLFPNKKDLVYNIYPELVDILNDNVRAQECSKPVLKFLKKLTKKKTQKSIKDIIAKCDKHFYDRASNPSPSEEDKVAGPKCVSDLKAKYKL